MANRDLITVPACGREEKITDMFAAEVLTRLPDDKSRALRVLERVRLQVLGERPNACVPAEPWRVVS